MDEQKARSCLTPSHVSLYAYTKCACSHTCHQLTPMGGHVPQPWYDWLAWQRNCRYPALLVAGVPDALPCLPKTQLAHCAFVKKYLSRSVLTGCSHAVRNTRLLLTLKTDIINTMQESGFPQLIQIPIRPPGEAGWLANPRSIK